MNLSLFISTTISHFKTKLIPINAIIYCIEKNDNSTHKDSIINIIKKLNIQNVYCDSIKTYNNYKIDIPNIKIINQNIPTYKYINDDITVNFRKICISGYFTILFVFLFDNKSNSIIYSIMIIIILITFWFLVQHIIIQAKWSNYLKSVVYL
jgi:hypothetical protein